MIVSGDDERKMGELTRAAHDGDTVSYERLLRMLAAALRKIVRQRRRFLQPPDVYRAGYPAFIALGVIVL